MRIIRQFFSNSKCYGHKASHQTVFHEKLQISSCTGTIVQLKRSEVYISHTRPTLCRWTYPSQISSWARDQLNTWHCSGQQNYFELHNPLEVGNTKYAISGCTDWKIVKKRIFLGGCSYLSQISSWARDQLNLHKTHPPYTRHGYQSCRYFAMYESRPLLHAHHSNPVLKSLYINYTFEHVYAFHTVAVPGGGEMEMCAKNACTRWCTHYRVLQVLIKNSGHI